MPIGAVAAREGPNNRFDRQTLGNMGVVVDIERIVVVDEAVLNCLTEDDQDRQQEKTADGQPRARPCGSRRRAVFSERAAVAGPPVVSVERRCFGFRPIRRPGNAGRIS